MDRKDIDNSMENNEQSPKQFNLQNITRNHVFLCGLGVIGIMLFLPLIIKIVQFFCVMALIAFVIWFFVITRKFWYGLWNDFKK